MKTALMQWIALGLALCSGVAGAGGDALAGKTKSAMCATCHGVDGNSDSAQFPRLAGQYPDYLIKALSDYKSGERKNVIMAGFAANLSPRDMADLAAWYASQRGLYTK